MKVSHLSIISFCPFNFYKDNKRNKIINKNGYFKYSVNNK